MKPFTKLLVPIVILLSLVDLWAANPSYSSFNPLQFSTNGQRIISIRNGAVITNLNVITNLFINSTNIFNLFAPSGTSNTFSINPTDTYVPYRVNSTTFGDSPWNRITTNTLGFFTTNQFIWQPSDSTLVIGHRAGEDRFIGNNVTAIGPFAMQNADSAFQSVAIGHSALKLSQGGDNVAIGHLAMQSALAANNSTAVGFIALDSVTDGFQNSAFGAESLNTVVTGTDNSGFGYATLAITTGEHNTAVGSKAGQTNTTGNANIFLGYDANAPNATATNSIVIGYRGVGNGSNTTVVGNTNTVSAHIIASGYDGTGTHFLSDDGTYKVGGGGGGTTINPSDNYLPVRANSTTFADSGLYRVGVTNTATDGQFIFGPGTTNVLYRSGTDLIYTNGMTGVTTMYFKVVNGAGNQLMLGQNAAGVPQVKSSTSNLYLDQTGGVGGLVLNNGMFGPQIPGSLDLGQSALPWKDFSLTNRILWQIPGVATNLLMDLTVSGSPEGVVTALPGSVARDTSNGILYVKVTGSGTTGWNALGSGAVTNVAESIWTNITGFVTMRPGMAATNTLNFTSGAADNATNIVLHVDTANSFTQGILASFGTSGAKSTRLGSYGTLDLGRFANVWSDPATSQNPGMYVVAALEHGSNQSQVDVVASDDAGNNYWVTTIRSNTNQSYITIEDINGQKFIANPFLLSSGSAIPYKFDTASNLNTAGDLVAAFGNAGSNVNTIWPNGAIQVGPNTKAYWGNSTAGDSFVSVRDVDAGENDYNNFYMGTTGNTETYFNLVTKTNDIFFAMGNGSDLVSFNPTVASGGSAVAAKFDTANALVTGDSTLLGQSAGVTQFRVDGDSGYTGAGTLFLSDDGTYKAAGGGGGGDALWFDVGGFAALTNTMEGVIIAHDSSVGDDPNIDFDLYSTMDPTFNDYGNFYAVAVTNYTQIALTANSGGVENAAVFMQANANGAAFIRMETQGSVTNGFFVTAPSGYAGAGTKTLTDDGTYKAFPASYGAAASDATTAITTFANKSMFRMPHAMTLTGVRASLATAQASGSTFTVDIKESGTTVLSTLITIDNTEKTSTTAAVPPVISDAALADDAEITVSVTQVGNGTAIGLVIWLNGSRTP